MKSGVLLSIALLALASVGRADEFFISTPTEWARNGQPSATASVLIFRDGGEFAQYGGTVLKTKSGAIAIHPNEGYIILLGSWSRSSNSVTTKSRYIYKSIPTVGEKIPGPEVEDRWTLTGPAVAGSMPSRIAYAHGSFVRLNRVDHPEGLWKLIQFHQKESMQHPYPDKDPPNR